MNDHQQEKKGIKPMRVFKWAMAHTGGLAFFGELDIPKLPKVEGMFDAPWSEEHLVAEVSYNAQFGGIEVHFKNSHGAIATYTGLSNRVEFVREISLDARRQILQALCLVFDHYPDQKLPVDDKKKR
ncbi:MAG: hypothetical protein V1848_02670 [Candidatus Magasanikbacteria bacterium]